VADLTFKLIIGGESGVGKTTFLHKYVEGRFLVSTKTTLGVDILQKDYTFEDEVSCSLQLWDFGGQERFRFLLDGFVRGASGVFLMFDLTSMFSFLKLKNWVEVVRKFEEDLPILLIGSKYDLKEIIVIEDERAEELIEQYDFIDYIKTSSKTGYHVQEAFDKLMKTVRKYRGLEEIQNSSNKPNETTHQHV
jgi:small GTP-binding protein